MAKETRLTPEERQDLVAYLDKEVDPNVALTLEAKISNSVSARKEVEELEKTWEMLDFLPMPQPPQDLSQRTMELLAQADQRKVELGGEAVERVKAAAMIGVYVAAVAASFALGYFVTTLLPDRSERLLKDLPVVERYEEYRAIGDVEFLRLLRAQKTLDNLDDPFFESDAAEGRTEDEK